MWVRACAEEEVLGYLRNGGELWYFYIEGAVTIHKNGKRIKDCFCPVKVFLELREKEIITKINSLRTGYPHYTSNTRAHVYALAQEARLATA